MMKNFSFKLMLLLMAGLLVAGCAAKAPSLDLGGFQAKTFMGDSYAPKVDNFEVIMDSSSSMGLKYRGNKKFDIEKALIERMNQTLPEIGYTGFLRSFGPNTGGPQQTTILLYGPEVYTQAGFAKGLAMAKVPGGTTPLGRAITAANGDLKDTKGKTAVIIFSDFEDTENNPVGAAKKLKEDYPEVCIYPVLVGASSKSYIGNERTQAEAVMEEIAKAGGCGFASTAEDIYTPAGMADFVEKIFLTPVAKPLLADTTPTIGDTDGDGVLNNVDRCPTTPAGARVDTNGCWVTPIVYFDFDKDYLKPEFHFALDEMAAVMRNNPSVNITMVLEGNCDSIGTEAYNLGLSDRRANQVANYLIKGGVPAANLSTVGYGFSNPAASNDTDEGRALNRRTELVPSIR